MTDAEVPVVPELATPQPAFTNSDADTPNSVVDIQIDSSDQISLCAKFSDTSWYATTSCSSERIKIRKHSVLMLFNSTQGGWVGFLNYYLYYVYRRGSDSSCRYDRMSNRLFVVVDKQLLCDPRNAPRLVVIQQPGKKDMILLFRTGDVQSFSRVLLIGIQHKSICYGQRNR